MIVKESFHRGPELDRRPRQLPAAVYNRTRLLLAHSDTDCVFVPIRSLQYQAVIDREEVIFVDGMGPRVVQLAWQGFRPQTREALDAPVPYDLVTFTPPDQDIVQRLQGEFAAALVVMEQRLKAQSGTAGGARVVAFEPH